MNLRTLLYIAAVFLVVGFLAVRQQSSDAAVKPPGFAGVTETKERTQAGELTLLGFDGSTLELSGLRGEVVVLYWWASWCPACIARLTSLQALSDSLGPEGLRVLLVNVDKNDVRSAHAFLERRKFRLIGWIPTSNPDDLMKGQALPTTVIIDRQGRVVTRIKGSVDFNTQKARNWFRTVLKEG